MTEHEEQPQQDEGTPETPDKGEPSTSPPDETHEATTPPGGGDVDEEAVEKAEEGLGQAGGGH